MRVVLLLLIAAASGCNRPAHGERMVPMKDLALTWSVSRQGSTLQIQYDVTNTGTQPAWVVDDMLVLGGKGKFTRAPKAIIVRQGATPDTVELYRGDMDIP